MVASRYARTKEVTEAAWYLQAQSEVKCGAADRKTTDTRYTMPGPEAEPRW